MSSFTLPAPHSMRATVPVRRVRVEIVGSQSASSAVEGECLTVGTARDNSLVVVDPMVSRYHLELTAREGGILLTDPGSTNGTWINDVRIERALVPPNTVLTVGRTRIRAVDAGGAVAEIRGDSALGGLRGRAPVMRRLMAQLEQAAASDVSLLLTGDSGSGKEIAARTLHDLSSRASGPFVIVDCGALTPTLVASELFGHERGAFTGAVGRHIGAMERAAGGTLLLDEVGDLPLELQPALLGVLERRRFRRLGGAQDVAFDARVVGATHHDLRADVNAGRFRLDLYYRLAVVTLRLPPLRERSADVPLLIEHFLAQHGRAAELGQLFPAEEIERLCALAWPGNVRELRNYVDARLAMGEATAPPEVGESGAPAVPVPAVELASYREARTAALADFERAYLVELLRRCGNNVSKAARLADMDRNHLADLLRRNGLR